MDDAGEATTSAPNDIELIEFGVEYDRDLSPLSHLLQPATVAQHGWATPFPLCVRNWTRMTVRRVGIGPSFGQQRVGSNKAVGRNVYTYDRGVRAIAKRERSIRRYFVFVRFSETFDDLFDSGTQTQHLRTATSLRETQCVEGCRGKGSRSQRAAKNTVVNARILNSIIALPAKLNLLESIVEFDRNLTLFDGQHLKPKARASYVLLPSRQFHRPIVIESELSDLSLLTCLLPRFPVAQESPTKNGP